MSQACPNIVGSRVSFKWNGKVLHVKSDVEIEPSTFERDAEMTSDGSLAVSVKPCPAKATITFVEKPDGDVLELWEQCSVDVTIPEIDTGDRHFLTGATPIGKPKKNLSTGEFSGIEIVTANYTRQRG